MSRNWVPCRSCGKNHTNPSSSSTCKRCNDIYFEEKKLIEEDERRAELEKRRNSLNTAEALEQLLEALSTNYNIDNEIRETADYILGCFDKELL